MASSSWSVFAKTTLVPMLIALFLYVLTFLILLPLYRRYRSNLARYSNYTPLSSSLAHQTTSLFEPYLIEPSKTLLQKLRDMFVGGLRWALVPSDWARQVGANRRSGDQWTSDAGRHEDEEGDDVGLFDAESGEAMVGFNGQRELQAQDRDNTVTPRNLDRGVDVDDSNRRLSRELEEGFRDDSASEASDEEVTVGRRTVSRRGSEVRR